ncbi:MAG TPA: transposase, partial [Gammaproteobacteria bacterium]|nr:transposase [Gammaproteobacteria bacterium]
MTNFRCARVPGSTHFFTVNLAEHNRTLLIEHVDWFKHVLREERKTHLFRLMRSWCCQITCTRADITQDDASFSGTWMPIKA